MPRKYATFNYASNLYLFLHNCTLKVELNMKPGYLLKYILRAANLNRFQIDDFMQISAFRTEAAILYCHELQTDHLMDNKIRHTLQIFLDQESSYYSQE